MRPRDWVSVAFGAAAALVATLGAGGAFRWVEAVVAGLLAVAVAVQLPSRRRFDRRLAILWLLSIAIALTAISLIPLPEAVRSVLDPEGTALRADGSALLDIDPWPCLSRDPAASLGSLVFLVTLLGVALVALRVCAMEKGRYRVLAGVSILCSATALVTLAHVLVGAKTLYGFYEIHSSPSVLGPLLNENHFGSLMALGTCVSVGLLMFRRQTAARRALWMGCTLLCGVMTGASHSRGAIVSLVIGGLVTGALMIAQRFAVPTEGRRRRSRLAANSLPIAIVSGCVIVLVIYSSTGSVNDELSRTSLAEIHAPRSKFAAWRSAEQLVTESPWVGVGRGGFESSFTRIHPSSGSVTFGYLENEYLQVVVDWGIPGAVLLASAAVWLLGSALRRWREGPLFAGGFGALTAVAVQSNVDFGVELLGLAIPVTVVAVSLIPLKLEEAKGAKLAKARLGRGLVAAGLLVGTVLMLGRWTRTIRDDHEGVLSAHPSIADARESATRHPLDYFNYAIAAGLVHDASSIRLLNHALILHPTHPDLHRSAAKLLVRSGHLDQATIEYSAAIRGSLEPDKLITEITTTLPADRAAAAIPFDYPELDRMVRVLQQVKHPEVATLWLGRVLALEPHNVHACNLLYTLSLDQGDLKAAEEAGRYCVQLMPDQQTRTALADLLFKRGKFTEILPLLADVEQWHGRRDEKARAWLLLCDANIELGQWDAATSCLRHLELAGDLPSDRHDEITKRFDAIHDKRAALDLSASGSAKP